MPNWSFCRFAIKGKTEDVLRVINDAIENSVKYRNEFGTPVQVEPQTNINEAFNKLLEIGCTLDSNFDYLNTDEETKVTVDDRITMGTFRPIPLTFLKYDTTNCPEVFPEAVKEQKETYGVVGWYDFNKLTFGCKWNTELTNFNLYTNGEYTTITFDSDTPWTTPDAWLIFLKEKYPTCGIFIFATEESGAFYFYHEIEEPDIDFSSKIEDKMNEVSDDPDSHEYWELRSEAETDVTEEMYSEFLDYVGSYRIGEC